MSFIDAFQEILIKTIPTEIEVIDDFDRLPLIQQMCKKYRIKISQRRLRYLKFQIVKWFTTQIQPSRYKRINQKKIRTRLELFKSKKKEIQPIKDKVVFAVATAYRRKIFDLQTGNSKNGEFLIGPIIDMVRKMAYEVVGLDLDYTFKGQEDLFS